MSALTSIAALGLAFLTQTPTEPVVAPEATAPPEVKEVLDAQPVPVDTAAPAAAPEGEWHVVGDQSNVGATDVAVPHGPPDGPIALGMPWSRGQAYVLPQGRVEVGVLAPLRYGWLNCVELSTHPILDIVMPNLAVKKHWGDVAGGVFATRHNLMYPTGLLTVLSRAGTGGILPHETRVPSIIALDNEALYSRPLIGRHVVTGKLGLTLAEGFGRSTLTTIDLPIVFPRTAAFTKHMSADLGVGLQGPIWGAIAYAVDADLFLMADRTSTVAAETSGLVIWQATEGFRAQLGAMLAYSQLPYGSMWGWMPLVDAIWAF